MNALLQERRRFPRVAPGGTTEFLLDRRLRVRVLDISATGALLAADEPVSVGSTGRLHVPLGGTPFMTAIQVARELPAPEGKGRLLGVAIVSQPMHQTVLDEFLKRAGS